MERASGAPGALVGARGGVGGARREFGLRDVCFIVSKAKARRLGACHQTPAQRRRAPRQRRPSRMTWLDVDLDQRDGACAGAGGTIPSTGRGGVSVWTPLGGASL